jgi:hypothetical protein
VGRTGALVGDTGAGVGRTGALVGDTGAGVGRIGALVGDTGAGVGRIGALVGDTGAGVGRTGAVVGEIGAMVGDGLFPPPPPEDDEHWVPVATGQLPSKQPFKIVELPSVHVISKLTSWFCNPVSPVAHVAPLLMNIG